MKTILSLAVLAFVALSFTSVQATAPSPDLDALAPFAWDVECAKLECPIESEIVLSQTYWAHDCESVPKERIQEAAENIAERFCEKFKECCGLNGCTSEGYCRLVKFTSTCVSDQRLVIKVKIAFKCK